MKRLLLLILLAFSILTLADDTPFDWSGLERSKISLEAPLLIVKGSLGFLGCGYINVDACADEACAIVTGVNTCLLYTSPSPRDRTRSRMPSSA